MLKYKIKKMRNFTGNVILDLFLELFEKLGVKTSFDMII